MEKLAQAIASGIATAEAGRGAGYSKKTSEGQIYRIAKDAYVVSRVEELTGQNKCTQSSNPAEALTATSCQLVEYIKVIRSTADQTFILDEWQIDLCNRLELHFWLANARNFQFREDDDCLITPSGFKIGKQELETKKSVGIKVAIHAFPQAGKSIIISHLYLSWILGQDPRHRIRLATYSVAHSKRFSGAIRRTLESPHHREFFPDAAGYVNRPARADEWSTPARLAVNDGQASFIALGLESGFTGSGADTLIMDDPYPNALAAFSPKIRENVWSFWIDTAKVRCQDHSNVFLMFHRYHQDDQAGRAISLDNFELWRYPAQEDGPYEEPESGRVFDSPFPRREGSYLSDRRSSSWYEGQKRNPSVWLSQFQGRPAPKGGSMFDITKFQNCRFCEVPELLLKVRAWDNAATLDGGSYTVGDLRGIDAAGNIYVLDVIREQVNTAQREDLQKRTAMRDGKLTAIHIPQDPGSAGKDVAFWATKEFKGYEISTDPVSLNKEHRAYNYSVDVNKGKVFLVMNDDGTIPDWHRHFLNEHQHFPNSTYKDQIDAGSDGHKYLTDRLVHGRVIKGVSEHNMLGWDRFAERFGPTIPEHWEVTVGCRISEDHSRPSAYAIMARAAENAQIGEVVFVVASRKLFVGTCSEVLVAIITDLNHYCGGSANQASTIWVARENDTAIQLAWEKHTLMVQAFPESADAGLPETGWYFQKLRHRSPFHLYDPEFHPATSCYLLVDSAQVREAHNDEGQLSLRQELIYWSYNTKGNPQPNGGDVIDCVRMNLYNFALTATALSPEERREMRLPEHLQKTALLSKVGKEGFDELFWQRRNAETIMMREEKFRQTRQNQSNQGRLVFHRRYHRRK